MSAQPQPVEVAEAVRVMTSPAPVAAASELPMDVRDLVFAYLRISSPEVRRAALRAVRAMAQP